MTTYNGLDILVVNTVEAPTMAQANDFSEYLKTQANNLYFTAEIRAKKDNADEKRPKMLFKRSVNTPWVLFLSVVTWMGCCNAICSSGYL